MTKPLIKIDATTASAFDIFNEILNSHNEENASDEICLISGKPLDNSRVRLPCNHSFNYEPLITDIIHYRDIHGSTYKNPIQCPYCRRLTFFTIPYRPDVSKVKRKNINMPVASCFEKHQCAENGCVTNATIPLINDTFACYFHYRKFTKNLNKVPSSNHIISVNTITENNNKCNSVLKTGNRKGQLCGAKVTADSLACKRHSK